MLAEEETRDIIGNLTTMNSRFLASVGKDKRFLNESPFIGRRRAVHVGREAAEALALAVVDARGGGGGAVPVVVAVGGLQIPG